MLHVRSGVDVSGGGQQQFANFNAFIQGRTMQGSEVAGVKGNQKINRETRAAVGMIPLASRVDVSVGGQQQLRNFSVRTVGGPVQG